MGQLFHSHNFRTGSPTPALTGLAILCCPGGTGPALPSVTAGGGQGWLSHSYDHRASSLTCLQCWWAQGRGEVEGHLSPSQPLCGWWGVGLGLPHSCPQRECDHLCYVAPTKCRACFPVCCCWSRSQLPHRLSPLPSSLISSDMPLSIGLELSLSLSSPHPNKTPYCTSAHSNSGLLAGAARYWWACVSLLSPGCFWSLYL